MKELEERLAALEKRVADLETFVQGQQTTAHQDWAKTAGKFANALQNPSAFFNREVPGASRDTSAGD